MIKNIKQKNLKILKFFIIEGLYFIMIDYFNQYLITRSFNIHDYIIKEAVLFNVIWVLIIFMILYVLKPKLKKIVTTIIDIFLLLFSVANYFMYSYFSYIFSWNNLMLSKDGASFISSIFKFINLKLILFILVCILFITLIIKLKTTYIYKLKSFQTVIILLLTFVLVFGHYKLSKNLMENTNDGWNADVVLNNYDNYYANWVDSSKSIRISGSYEYLIRDFYITFLQKDNKKNAKKNVEKYIKNNKEKSKNNEYTGIFKDKNLIFIMMESMDNWLINEDVTPTIYEMMNHGFNFQNHYSPGYVTGDTANTEFIANTGLYPNINKLSPNYAYVDNDYPFAIANLFKNEGYSVNSFHRSNGFIYNRENMHLSLGYEKYHNYEMMNISSEYLDLDSYIAKNAYKKITNGDKFMSFIITYSPHSPYTYDKIECQENLDVIEKIYPNETEEEIKCAYSSARETDNMFKILLEKLEKNNLLDDTVIVAFTDHPNHVKLLDNETDILNNTIFFIYNSNMDNNNINTITSTINILPTVINLFGIDTNYIYPGYDALDTEDEYVIFKDYSYYDGTNVKTLTKKMYDEVNYSANVLISNYYEYK